VMIADQERRNVTAAEQVDSDRVGS